MQLTNKIIQQFSFRYHQVKYIKQQQTFHAKNLIKNLRSNPSPRPQISASTLLFGKYSSDHMVQIDHDIQSGWAEPKIIPFGPLSIDPFCSVLHYSIQCFEGLKAYRNQKDQIRLFRPECNAERFRLSTKRMSLPDFDTKEFLKVLEQFVRTEKDWIPPQSEFTLYLRPLHISMENSLGVKKPTKSKMLIMAGPVGPYYPTGFKPVSLSCSVDCIRSAPNGTGRYKIGGNYSPTMAITDAASSKGYQQILWLYDDKITEVGSSNIFFVFKDASGQIEVATPLLQDLILPGVTRDSILTLLESEKQYKVSERIITMTEFAQRHRKGEVLECFGAGTAVIVSPVKAIEYKGKVFEVPLDPNVNAGPITLSIRKKILDIQQGRVKDNFGWSKKIN